MTVNLSIKDVPEALAARLRARAARNHRSLQGELMAVIEQAAAAELPATLGTALASPVETNRHGGWKTVEDLMAERRNRPPLTTPGLPLGVDIIRADRDSR